MKVYLLFELNNDDFYVKRCDLLSVCSSKEVAVAQYEKQRTGKKCPLNPVGDPSGDFYQIEEAEVETGRKMTEREVATKLRAEIIKAADSLGKRVSRAVMGIPKEDFDDYVNAVRERDGLIFMKKLAISNDAPVQDAFQFDGVWIVASQEAKTDKFLWKVEFGNA